MVRKMTEVDRDEMERHLRAGKNVDFARKQVSETYGRSDYAFGRPSGLFGAEHDWSQRVECNAPERTAQHQRAQAAISASRRRHAGNSRILVAAARLHKGAVSDQMCLPGFDVVLGLPRAQ